MTIRIGTLKALLLLEFSSDHFETMYSCSTWSVDVHVVYGLSSDYFLPTFSTFSTQFFSGSLSIRIDTLLEQRIVEFSTDHFETMLACST